MARPKTGRYDTKKIVAKMNKYTEDTQLPILKEFCFQNELDYKYFLQLCADDVELDKARCRLLTKKEIQLEKALMAGGNNTAFIFQLKQLGWKDNPEPVVINNNNNVTNKTATHTEKLRKLSTEELEDLEDIYSKIDSETEEKTNA